MKSARWIVSYILVASIGLWLAFFMSMKFMTPAHSQEAPGSGELPAEFLQEVQSTQVPDAPPVPAPDQGPAVPPQQEPSQPNIPPPPPQPEQVQGQGAPVFQEPGTSFVQDVDFAYDPTGKRDPFTPFRTVRIVAPNVTRPLEELEPLQRWDLERLQVVGILWDVRSPRAMIRDPDGGLFTIVKNSKIGRNEGFVAAIREGEIVVVETIYAEGNPTKESRVLELKK